MVAFMPTQNKCYCRLKKPRRSIFLAVSFNKIETWAQKFQLNDSFHLDFPASHFKLRG